MKELIRGNRFFNQGNVQSEVSRVESRKIAANDKLEFALDSRLSVPGFPHFQKGGHRGLSNRDSGQRMTLLAEHHLCLKPERGR